jgi:outer membrane lipoprotein-sorting protein
MNKMIAMMLAGVMVLGLVSIVTAANITTKPAHKGLRGKIVKVDGVNVTVKTGRGETAKEVVVATDDKTVVTVDEKAATVADLKEGMYVKVTPAEGTATEIKAMTKRPEKAPK